MRDSMKNKHTDTSLDATSIITLGIVAITWAGSFIFIKIGLREVPPITLALIRFALAFPVIGIVTLLTEAKKDAEKKFREDFVPFSILALTGVTLLYILQYYSMKYTSASTGSIIMNTSVIFIAVFSAVVLKEKIGARKIVGILLAFFGLFITISKCSLDVFRFDAPELFGDALMIASAVCWAIYSIYSKKILQSYSPMFSTSVVFGLGAFYLVPFALLESPLSVITEITWQGWASIFYLSFFSSVFGYVLWNRGLTKVETVKVAMFLYLIPVLTTILSYLFLSEEITYATVAGAALVIFGVYLTETS